MQNIDEESGADPVPAERLDYFIVMRRAVGEIAVVVVGLEKIPEIVLEVGRAAELGVVEELV